MKVSKNDISHILFDEHLSVDQSDECGLFIVCPYLDVEFVPAVKGMDIDSLVITLKFLNEDKAKYPDLHFHLSDIRAIQQVVRVDVDVTAGLPCHCASDGEFCGPSCIEALQAVAGV